MHFWSPQGTWNCLSVSCLLLTWYPVCARCGRHQLLHHTVQDHWRCRSRVYGLCEPRFGHFVQLRLAVFICKSLKVNAMKRLIIKFCVLRPHKNGSGKNNFQWCKSMTVRCVKWCRRSTVWRKSEKKFRKSLQVQKKCLPLQSRYETRASQWGRKSSTGVRKRAAEAAEYDGVHWKDWNESTRKQVPNTKNRER